VRPRNCRSLNSFLPSDIRVHGLTKVTKSFNAKQYCGKRRYQYLLPTYVLQDVANMMEILTSAYESQRRDKECQTDPDVVKDEVKGEYNGDPNFANLLLTRERLQSCHSQAKQFRIDSTRLELLRFVLKQYEGTKLYHNYTTGKHPSDPSAKRFIISFDCSDPFLDGVHGQEWVLLSVVGQSFLLNQIRRMVSMAIECVRGACSAESFETSFTAKRVSVSFILVSVGILCYVILCCASDYRLPYILL
jgi:tRNA pseudouridine38-40 synthase